MKTIAVTTAPSLMGGEAFNAKLVVFKNFVEEAGHLREMVTDGTRNLALRELVLSIIKPAARAKAESDQALAVAKWVQDNIYYVHEGMETFQMPETTLRLRAGDCDDFTTLICSMLGTIGIRTKMCILKINGRWAHIFPVALVKQDGEMHRLTLDATLDEPVTELINPIAVLKKKGAAVETYFA